MGNKYPKSKAVALPVQLLQLRQTYGDVIVESEIKGSVLRSTLLLTPSRESATYKILISYKLSDYAPHAFLIEPMVQLHDGKLPEHVYNYDKDGHPRLCVYHPGSNEWDRKMFLSTSFVPWILTWLNAYEYWLITGEWFYPSISHGKKKE